MITLAGIMLVIAATGYVHFLAPPSWERHTKVLAIQAGMGFRDIARVLEENGIIDNALSTKLQEMAQFRNLLVHRYGQIDTRRIYIIMSNDLKDIQAFVKNILKYIY